MSSRGRGIPGYKFRADARYPQRVPSRGAVPTAIESPQASEAEGQSHQLESLYKPRSKEGSPVWKVPILWPPTPLSYGRMCSCSSNRTAQKGTRLPNKISRFAQGDSPKIFAPDSLVYQTTPRGPPRGPWRLHQTKWGGPSGRMKRWGSGCYDRSWIPFLVEHTAVCNCHGPKHVPGEANK